MGTGKIFNVEELITIAKKHRKTIAQIAIRWSIRHGFLPLPKTATLDRAAENIDVFDFEISKVDMKILDSLEDCARRMFNPDEINF